MSRTIWPVSEDFPQMPLRVGYKEIPPSVVERTSMSAGPDKVAVVATGGWRHFACSYYMETQQQQDVFNDFWLHDIRGGQHSFTWPHPRTESGIQVEFASKPQTTHDTAWRRFDPVLMVGTESDTWVTTIAVKTLETVVPTGTPATWPVAGSFPQFPRMGAKVEHPGLTLSSDVHQRQRSIANPFVVGFELILTAAQLITFDTFFVTACGTGAETFAWDTPSVEYSWGSRSTGGNYANCRFIGQPTYGEVSTNYRVTGNVEFIQG